LEADAEQAPEHAIGRSLPSRGGPGALIQVNRGCVKKGAEP